MDWTHTLDIGEKIAKIVAVVVGGLWVYFNSFRGRTFVPRLQVELSGKFASKEGVRYLVITMQARNIGSTIVKIKERGTGLIVTPLSGGGRVSGARSLIRGKATAFNVFEMHREKKIEPGIAIHQQMLVKVPSGEPSAYELELRVGAPRGTLWAWWRPDITQRAIATAIDSFPVETGDVNYVRG
jgi:hypothetical protein